MNDIDNEVEVVSSEVGPSKVDPRIIHDDLMSQNIPDKELSTESVDNRESVYYQDKGKKVTDFLLGFFGVYFINLILGFIMDFIKSIGIEFIDKDSVYTVFTLMRLIGLMFAVIYFSKKARKYIVIGIISMGIIQLLGYVLMVGVFFMWAQG